MTMGSWESWPRASIPPKSFPVRSGNVYPTDHRITGPTDVIGERWVRLSDSWGRCKTPYRIWRNGVG